MQLHMRAMVRTGDRASPARRVCYVRGVVLDARRERKEGEGGAQTQLASHW